jgi:AcrR family transcriptional regulator
MRADAERNRVKVLEAASAAFAEEGLAVSVQKIARRAGVGTGTVSRHFPTKEDLFCAIVLSRVERLLVRAGELARTAEPGEAFFEFFGYMVSEGAINRGLSEALTGAGFDMDKAALAAGYDVGAALRELLAGAQQCKAVRADVDIADVKALMLACLTREHSGVDEAARKRLTDVVRTGLRPSP